MNKRGLIKLSVTGILLVASFIVLTGIFSLNTTSAIKENYKIGDNIKIKLSEKSAFTLEIITPREKQTLKEVGDKFIYKVKETGKHTIILEYKRKKEVYEFEVFEEIPKKQKAKTEQKIHVNPIADNKQSQVEINKVVRWEEKIELTDHKLKEIEIEIPSKAENIVIEEIDKTGRKQKNAKLKENKISNTFSNEDLSTLTIENIKGDIEISYETPAPTIIEKQTSKKTKEISVMSPEGINYEDILTYSEIPESEKITSKKEIKINLKEEESPLEFKAIDSNSNGIIDKVEWITPSSGQTVEIIIITKALHLDQNKNLVEDITKSVIELDNTWAEIPKENYVRVSFEKNLTRINDITIFARSSYGGASIEVYEKDKTELIATFPIISQEDEYKIILNNLEGEQDTFDLKIIGAPIEFDLIIDPTIFAASNEAGDVAIAAINETAFIVVWGEDGPDDVYLQIWDTGGNNITGVVVVDTNAEVTTSDRVKVAVDAINETTFIVGWSDFGDGSGNSENIEVQWFNIDGTSATAIEVVDDDVGHTNTVIRTGVSIAENDDRYVVCHADDQADDFDASIYNLSDPFNPNGEVTIDSNIGPANDRPKNRGECFALNDTTFVAIYYDDGGGTCGGGDDITFTYFDEFGVEYDACNDADIDVGASSASGVAGTALENGDFALIWGDQDNTDGDDDTLQMAIYDINGNSLFDAATIHAGIGNNEQAKFAMATVKNEEDLSQSHFIAAWYDPGSADIRARLYNSTGGNLTDDFVLANNPDPIYDLFDVYGQDTYSGTEICPGRFIFAYTNTSDDFVIQTLLINGTEWDGQNCPATEPPLVTINFPSNTTYGPNDFDLTFNVTLNKIGSHVFYTLDDGINNVTMSEIDNFEFTHANTSLADGTYTIRFYSNDTFNNRNDTESVTFSVDQLAPSLILDHPQNISYNIANISLNFTIIDQNSDTCWYTNNSGLNNYTLASCLNITYGATQDSTTIELYANDTLNNINDSESVTFFVDSIFPLIEYTGSVEDSGLNFSRNYIIANVSVTEANEANITFRLFNSTQDIINETTFIDSTRVLNWSLLSNGMHYYNVTIVDITSNSNTTETRQIGLDTEGPNVTILEPEDGKTYSDNVSLALNYTIRDNLVGEESCWWNLDAGSNITITCGTNHTFNTSDGNHVVYFFANDTLGNLAIVNSSFAVSTQGPAITLIEPTDNTYLNYTQDIFFNYTTLDPDGVDTCHLYGSWNGGWHINQTDTQIENATSNNFYANITDGDGRYLWNVWCNDSLGLESFAVANYTLTIDLTSPLIYFSPENVTDDTEDAFTTSGSPTNPLNAIDENYATFATIDADPDIDILYINYTVSGVSATLEYLTDWNVAAGSFECYNSTDWTLITAMQDNVQTNVSIPDTCIYSTDLQIRAYRSLSTAFGLVNFYEENINWVAIPPAADNSNLSQNFIYVSVQVEEANEANITFRLFNSTDLEDSTVYAQNVRNINWTGLSDGTYTYNVTIFDLVTNQNTTETRTITLDTTSPNGTLINPLNNSFVNNATQNLTVNASDNLGLDNATLFVFNSTNDLINQTTASVSGTEALVGIVYNFILEGVFTWFYSLFDIAGNEFSTENFTTNVDITFPTINFTIGTPDNNTQFEQNSVFANVTLEDANFANVTFLLYNLDENTITNLTTFQSQTNSLNWTNINGGNVTYRYNVTVIDLSDNQNTTETRTITLIDTTPVELTLANPQNTTYTTNLSIPIDFVVNDLNLDTCWYTTDGGVTNNSISGCANTSFDIADGSHTLTLFANDTVGFLNSSSVSFTANSSLFETPDWITYRGSVTSLDGQLNISLPSAVDPKKSFVRLTTRDNNGEPAGLQVTGRLSNSTTLVLENYLVGQAPQVEWEIVTGPGLTVQRNEESYGTADIQINVSINPVNLSSAFAFTLNRLDSETQGNNEHGYWTIRFSNSTLLQIQRGVTGSAGVVSWQVIEWDGATVQNGSFSTTGQSTSGTLSSVVQENRSMLIFSKSVSSGSMDDANVHGYLLNSTIVQFYRDNSDGGTMASEFFVVEAPNLYVQRDFFIKSTAASPQTVAVSNPSRYFNKTFNFPYWDSASGGGNTFSRSYVTSEILNTTTIEFDKDHSNFEQNITWQFIEIIDIENPNITLLSPEDQAQLSSLTINQFNYSVNDTTSIINCTLYGDWIGNWHANQTADNPAGAIVNNFSSVTLSGDGTYNWSVECIDTYANLGSPDQNFTFIIDSQVPLIDYTFSTAENHANISQSWIFVNVTVTEANEANITFRLFNSTDLINESFYSTQVRNINFTDLKEGTYTYNVTVFDTFANQNTTETRTITLDTTSPNGTLINPLNNSFVNNATQNFTINASDNIELDNATLFIYNSTNDLVNSTSIEVTGTEAVVGIVVTLIDDIFTWFYSLFDIAGNEFSTENFTVTIDETAPLISYDVGTEDSGLNFSRDYIIVNISLTETNLGNLTYLLVNETAAVNQTNFTTSVTTLNFSSLPDSIYFYNVTAFDLALNTNATETRNITLDTTGPSITFLEPIENKVFGFNTSIDLNVSVQDELVGHDTCFWSLDGGPNTTIVCGNNATFNASDGAHIISFFANDSLGNNNTENVTFSVSTQGPAITLTTPQNNTYLNYSNDIIYNYTTTDPDGVDTCFLYGNWAGGWHINQTDTQIENATSNIFILNLTDGDANYIWNVECNDSLSLSRSAESNFTFTIDTATPLISFEVGTEDDAANVSRNYIIANVSVTEANEANITFRLLNSTGIVNTTTYFTPVRIINWTNLPEEKYFYDVRVADLAGHENVTETRALTLDTTPPSLIIAHPQNISYNTNISLPLNYTFSDLTPGDCWFTLDNGITNTTIPNCNNATFNTTTQGSNTLNLYANDTIGNINNSESVTFFVDSIDPVVTFIDPTRNNHDNLSQSWIFVNVSVVEANEANITFRLYNQTALINESTFSNSQRSLNWTGLNDTIYTYNVTVFDILTNQNTTETRTITLDTTSPNGTLVSPANATAVGVSSNLTVNASDTYALANVTLHVRNSTNDLINQTSSIATGTLDLIGLVYQFPYDDVFQWSYLITDIAGNNFLTENRSITADTSVPLIDFGAETAANHSNLSQSWIFVNVTVIELSESNITFRLFNTTDLVNETTYFTPIRTINFTNLEGGTYRYNVTVVDSFSNTNTTDFRFITIDFTTPNGTLINPINNSFVNNATQNFTINASDNIELDNATLFIYNSTNDLVNSTSIEVTGTEALVGIVVNLVEGVFTWFYSLFDIAGNEFSTENFTVTIDETAPLISYDVGTEDSGQNTSRTYIIVNISITETNFGNLTYILYNSTSLVNQTNFTTPVLTLNFSSLPDETYTYNVTIHDSAQNFNTTETRTITLDTTSPNGTLINPLNNSFINNATQNLTVNASDNLGLDNATLFVFNSTNDLINQTTASVSGTEALVGIVYNFILEGVFTWFYSLFDIAGNEFSTENFTVTIDLTNPQIEYESTTPLNNTNLDQDSIFIEVILTEENFENITYELYNATDLVNRTAYITNITSINWTELPSTNTTYFYNVTVLDLAGNSNFTETRTINLLDSNGPTINIARPEAKTYSTNISIPLNVTVTDRSGLSSCWWNLDDGDNTTITCNTNHTFNTSDGAHTLNFFANDSLGNNNTETRLFSVSTQGPAITLIHPADQENISSVGNITYFNYTAVDPLSIDTCSLYGNWTGNWHQNQSKQINWWDSNYLYRKDISITSISTSVLTDFPAYLNISHESSMQTDFEDLRFINGTCDSNQTLTLDYEVEYFDSNKADIWIRIPTLESGTTTLCMYYGNIEANDGQNLTGVWDSFYEGVYHLNHTSGDAIDYSESNSCNGGSCDAAESITPDSDMDVLGIVGRADRLDGTDFLGTNPEWDLDSTNGAFWTTCAWINYTVAHDGTIFEDGGNSQGHGMAVLSSGSLRAADVNGGIQAADSPSAYNDGLWHHACGVCNSTAGTMELYVDGDLVATDSAGVNCAIGGGDARIGQGNGGNGAFDATVTNPLNATLDELRVSNIHRSEGWINQSYEIVANQDSIVSLSTEESYVNLSFFEVNITEQGYFLWNVECNNTNGNTTFSPSNATFALFLSPIFASLLNATQTLNDGTGDVTLYWSSVTNSPRYRIYHNESINGNFTLLNITSNPNYTDTTFSSHQRRFYRVDTWNPTDQNASRQYFGSHVYTFMHNQNTRNWISFPTNSTNLITANETLNSMTNITAFTMWNGTSQQRVTCNEFSCPDAPSCTPTNCNFEIEQGYGYETNLNTSSPNHTNWSLVGIVFNETNITLFKNSTDFGKNWITLTANTTINSAQVLFENITGVDAVSYWDESAQTSRGLIANPFGSGFVGTNFNITLERAYEVSVTTSVNWTQV